MIWKAWRPKPRHIVEQQKSVVYRIKKKSLRAVSYVPIGFDLYVPRVQWHLSASSWHCTILQPQEVSCLQYIMCIICLYYVCIFVCAYLEWYYSARLHHSLCRYLNELVKKPELTLRKNRVLFSFLGCDDISENDYSIDNFASRTMATGSRRNTQSSRSRNDGGRSCLIL